MCVYESADFHSLEQKSIEAGTTATDQGKVAGIGILAFIIIVGNAIFQDFLYICRSSQ